MVYISKINVRRLFQVKIIQCPPSWLEKKLKKLSVPSKYQSFGLALVVLSYVLTLFYNPDTSWFCKIVVSLTLPLSFILFYSSEQITEKKIYKEQKELFDSFQSFFWTIFYSNLLALTCIQVIPDDISKIMLLCSIHTLLYIPAWADYYKKSTHSSLTSFKVTEINFLLVTFFILHLTLINPTFPISSYAITILTLYSTLQFLKNFAFVLFNNDQSSISKLAPILILNINLMYWFYIEIFTSFKTSIFLTHSVLNILISYRLKVFSAAQEPLTWSQIEIITESLFLLHESTIKQIPTHPTYFIICIFIFIRCFSLYISLLKQLKHILG